MCIFAVLRQLLQQNMENEKVRLGTSNQANRGGEAEQNISIYLMTLDKCYY